jgi:hypothetical protein
MGILAWIILGLVVGVIAKKFSPSGAPEAPIGGGIVALRYPRTAAPLNALPMKASNS